MNMLKKILAILISLMMMTGAVTAFAEGNPPGDPPTGEMGTPPDGMPGEPPEGGMGTPPDGIPGEPPEGGMGTPPDGAPGGGFGGNAGPGGRTSSFEYAAATEMTEAASVSGETYTSETADESALMVNTDAEVSLDNVTVTKTGSSDGGDNCNFYGLNAAVLVMGGSTTTITGATITSDAVAAADGEFILPNDLPDVKRIVNTVTQVSGCRTFLEGQTVSAEGELCVKILFTGDASAKYYLEATGTTFRASMGKGYRSPSVYELYAVGKIEFSELLTS